jgi:hypothetical protein
MFSTSDGAELIKQKARRFVDLLGFAILGEKIVLTIVNELI